MLNIVIIPCLQDNYAYLIHDPKSQETALIDAPEHKPIISELDKRGWKLQKILLTHHHMDHVSGLEPLLKAYNPIVFGAERDQERLPSLHFKLKEGDIFNVGEYDFLVYDVSGHTIGHIAVYSQLAEVMFTADSLMALGCGRLFEGSAELMWQSLNKLMALPPATLIYSGHEYSEKNLAFAISVEPENKALVIRGETIRENCKSRKPNIPNSLAVELETNPFLRVKEPNLKKLLNMETSSNTEVFARLRKMRDNFS